MTLNNIKQMRKDRGFTIVELLIVIIVIAILAAIVIVAYVGVTARANTSKNQTNAVSVQKKAEAFNADNTTGNGTYPGCVAGPAGAATPTCAITFNAATGLGQLPAGVTLQAGAVTSATNTSTVQYVACTGTAATAATGYYISYFDFTQNKPVYITGGTNVTPGANNTTAPTCSNPSTN